MEIPSSTMEVAPAAQARIGADPKLPPHIHQPACEPDLISQAVVFEGDKKLGLKTLELTAPNPSDLVIDVEWSGVSTGTERLLWSGEMPPFPGMGYPLVPGYEAVGRVVWAKEQPEWIGRRVFAPGANCYSSVNGLFGASASRIIAPAKRVRQITLAEPQHGVLLALAATAYHAIIGGAAPDLIVGHGVLGRLLARITIAMGAQVPVVWEINPDRADSDGYAVLDPDCDGRSDYRSIYDVSGDSEIFDTLVSHVSRGGEIVLAGFYTGRPSFAFPPAFMKEARFRVAAEWEADDLDAVLALIASGKLSLDGLITHTFEAARAHEAYKTAFEDGACLKMVLDWRGASD
ncbi:MAG: chlorophyll synthesis pathway protein BchC [Pseudomonadota bacterium]